MGMIGLPELLIILGTAILLFRGQGLRRFVPHGALSSRLLIFICGAAELQMRALISAGNFRAPNLELMIRGGLVWLILFELVYRTREHLRARTLPVYILLVWFVSRPLYIAAYVLSFGSRGLLTETAREYYSAVTHWLLPTFIYPYILLDLVSPTAFITITYLVIFRSSPYRSAADRIVATWSGCKGANMSPSKSQTTRLLCASAFLLGPRYRRDVLEYLEKENHGVSPELGVDLGLVARVCQFAESRENIFQVYMFLALIGGLVLALVSPALGIGLYLAVTAILYFRKVHAERATLLTGFRGENFPSFDVENAFPAELEAAAVSALPSADQNLVAYTGFSPFVGAGTDLGGWSFTVDLSKPSEDLGPQAVPLSFKVEELYRAIVEKIANAGLDGLVTKDYYFVSGREIRDDRNILPDIFGRPLQRVEVGHESWYATGHDERIRRYKWIRIHDWGQELVMSYFLRCSISGSLMFVEINRYVLTPLADRYRGIDKITDLKVRHLISLLLAAPFVGPLYGLATPFLLLSRLIEAVADLFGSKDRRRRREIEENVQFDYGAGQGLRQALSSNQFAHYFQKADADFYTKVLERSILTTIVTFLDNRGIDTSDLRERQTMILNSGIIVHGGNVNAESLAVGSGAQAMKTTHSAKSTAKGAAA